MLPHPTIDQLKALKLDGMADAFAELSAQDRAKDLTPADWLALLLDRETVHRGTKRFRSRLRNARLRHGQASVEDVNYRAPRKLDKALFQELATCRWIGEHRNLLVTGPVRRRQVVAELRAGAESLPRRLHRLLRTGAAPLCRSGTRPR